ncbi:hypothetical protein RDI58_014394 [Solanum bulbocastanum]|uniref:Uncharacterized protein n=1 Tax=Solanum bulbocastanum TaxID=147425 RepID=A0AAN8TFU7_SOLBU
MKNVDIHDKVNTSVACGSCTFQILKSVFLPHVPFFSLNDCIIKDSSPTSSLAIVDSASDVRGKSYNNNFFKFEIRDCPFGDEALLANATKLETMRSLWMSNCSVSFEA